MVTQPMKRKWWKTLLEILLVSSRNIILSLIDHAPYKKKSGLIFYAVIFSLTDACYYVARCKTRKNIMRSTGSIHLLTCRERHIPGQVSQSEWRGYIALFHQEVMKEVILPKAASVDKYNWILTVKTRSWRRVYCCYNWWLCCLCFGGIHLCVCSCSIFESFGW